MHFLEKKIIWGFLSLSIFFTFAQASNSQSNIIDQELDKIATALENNQIKHAFNLSSKLINIAPNFQAGWVIYGDILNIMSGQWQKPENNSSRDQLAYRSEILKRLEALRSEQGTPKKITYPVLIPKSHEYWIYADLTNSRLYIVSNINQQIINSIYISQGYNGAFKNKEGDNRTPVGVYRITRFIPKNQLEGFYGRGAFPISYPNNFDIAMGKTGSGIWIHGVPDNLFSRPPLASNGCLVVANDDIANLANFINTNKTYIVTSNQSPFNNNQDSHKLISELQLNFEQWRQDWESLNSDKYLSHYAKDFTSDTNLNYESWSEYKKSVNSEKKFILVSVSDLAIIKYPALENTFWLSYSQDYQSDNYSQTSTKEQIWRKLNGSWQIIFEGRKSKGK